MIKSLPGDVSVQPITSGDPYILRGHDRHCGHGGPIVWIAIVTISGTVASISGLEVKFKGAKFTRRHAGAIKRWLIGMGVTTAIWERLDGSGFRKVEVTREIDKELESST